MLKQTNIPREKLKSTLVQNLTDHVELYKATHSAWTESFTKYVSDFAKKIKGGDLKTSYNPPHEPTSYAKQYEQVISQLEMSADDIITLDATEFKNYILDEWHFSDSVLRMSSTYLNSNTTIGYSAFDSLSASNKAKLSNISFND